MLRRRNLQLDNGPGWIAENPLAGVVGGGAEREKVLFSTATAKPNPPHSDPPDQKITPIPTSTLATSPV